MMFGRLLRLIDILRRALGALVFLAVIGLFVGVLLFNRPSVPSGSLLVLNPSGNIVEEVEQSASFPLDFSAAGQTRLADMLRAIDAAKTDQRIRGLLIDVQDMGHASLPDLEVLGRAIDRFRQSGKPVTAYADRYSQAGYLLAAHAGQVWLHPMGMVLLTGLSGYRNYFADALSRMHVKVHLFRAGHFKSAAEPLVRNDMSPDAKQETTVLLGQLWAAIKRDVAEARPVKAASIQAMLDDPAAALAQYSGDPAALAVGMHLVDKIGTYDEMLRALSGSRGAHAEPQQIAFRKYLHALGPMPHTHAASVGILTASGMITDGHIPGGLNGADFSDLVEKTADDPTIKAVVLRIDSPGGSVQASETIRRALLQLHARGKPLVVSMGGMAASGGYWIAAGADEIWAAPTSVTGSIGVFGIFPDLSGGLAALGIHSDGMGTTAMAGALRPDRPLPMAMSEVLQAGVDHVYASFLGIVAEGRNMSKQQAEKLADGRVWSGTDAVRLGLADHLGGLSQAVAAAARRAGLKGGYDVRYIRAESSLRERLMQRFLGEAGVRQAFSALDSLVGLNRAAWLNMLASSGGIYAFCDLSY